MYLAVMVWFNPSESSRFGNFGALLWMDSVVVQRKVLTSLSLSGGIFPTLPSQEVGGGGVVSTPLLNFA